MAYKQAKESFEIVLREMNSISGINKAQALKKCDNIESEIVRLHSSLETCVVDSNQEIERLQHQLEQLNADEVKLTAQEKSLEDKEKSLKADKKKAESKEESLKSEMRSLSRKIDEAREKIKEEEIKRKDAVVSVATSFNPVISIFSAIKDNDPKKLIPGYSLVNGLISLLSQEKENLESSRSRLERELREADGHLKQVSREIEEIERERSKISNELSVIRNSIVRIGEEIKKRGKNFTESGNALKGLKVSQNKFALVKNDLFMIRECVDNDVFEKDIFNDFIRQFRDTQHHFLAVCC